MMLQSSHRFLAVPALLAAALLALRSQEPVPVPVVPADAAPSTPVQAPSAPPASEFPAEPAAPVKTPAPVAVPAASQRAASVAPAKSTSPSSEASKTPGQAAVGARVGSGTQEFSAGLMFPVVSSSGNLLGLALRGTVVDDEEQEAGVGVVLRHLDADHGVIYGLNVFHDTRWTAQDNSFGVLGAGVELLTERVDLRANLHHPLDDPEALTETRRSDVTTAGGQRVTTTTLLRSHEESLEGFDVEAGLWIPGLPASIPTAVYAGYYDLTSDFAGDYSGVNLRLESHVTRRLTLDAQWMDDDTLTGTEFFVGARFTFPFGGSPTADAGSRGLAGRMGDLVRRDFRPRPIVGDAVPAGSEITRENIRRATSTPAPVRIRLPASPNCYLDGDGNVICD